jgi:hypothetical protein
VVARRTSAQVIGPTSYLPVKNSIEPWLQQAVTCFLDHIPVLFFDTLELRFDFR